HGDRVADRDPNVVLRQPPAERAKHLPPERPGRAVDLVEPPPDRDDRPGEFEHVPFARRSHDSTCAAATYSSSSSSHGSNVRHRGQTRRPSRRTIHPRRTGPTSEVATSVLSQITHWRSSAIYSPPS